MTQSMSGSLTGLDSQSGECHGKFEASRRKMQISPLFIIIEPINLSKLNDKASESQHIDDFQHNSPDFCKTSEQILGDEQVRA